MSQHREQAFPADAAALRDIRSFIRSCAEEDALPGEVTDDIILAVSEASTNAVVHTRTDEIRVRWRKQPGRVLVWVCDGGVFVERSEARTPDAPGGRGFPLMQATMDEVSVRPGTERRPGTVVRLEKRT